MSFGWEKKKLANCNIIIWITEPQNCSSTLHNNSQQANAITRQRRKTRRFGTNFVSFKSHWVTTHRLIVLAHHSQWLLRWGGTFPNTVLCRRILEKKIVLPFASLNWSDLRRFTYWISFATVQRVKSRNRHSKACSISPPSSTWGLQPAYATRRPVGKKKERHEDTWQRFPLRLLSVSVFPYGEKMAEKLTSVAFFAFTSKSQYGMPKVSNTIDSR